MSLSIVLASASPRRADILRSLGLEVSIRPPHVDETLLPGEDPHEAAERLAREKALATAPHAPDGALVLAADTIVVLDGEALGKPRDTEDARRMLTSLSGRSHDVVTGVAAFRSGELASGREVTSVVFAPMTAEEVDRYVASGEPTDKAGAYALQGIGGLFVERIEGTPSNVIGLPVRLVKTLAGRLGVELLR